MERLRSLPLRYRLIVPFIVLAFFGTCSLVWLAILSQNTLIQRQEHQRLESFYNTFLHTLELRGQWAVSLASGFARNPEIAKALADRDRMRLLQLCYPAYEFMRRHYGIYQFHFEVPPGRSFLRLHRLYQFGDELWLQRKQIQDVLRDEREVYGLEWGATGYGIRGVVPVYWQEQLVGLLEVGFSLGEKILEPMRLHGDADVSILSLHEGRPEGKALQVVGSTLAETFDRPPSIYASVFRSAVPQYIHLKVGNRPYAFLIHAVPNYRGEPATLVEVGVDRSDAVALTVRYRRWMLGLGLVGMILSVGAIYVIALFFTRPIDRMIAFAREIAMGRAARPLDMRPSGELGTLADALDEMLGSLEMSREQIKLYAATLEEKVQARTRELRESEEKYRTLVERVPLVVYRLDKDGTMVFVNRFVEDLLGMSQAEILERPRFWKEKVWLEDRDRIWPLMDQCLREGLEFREEYRVQHRNGQPIYVLDHALPALDMEGKVQMVDGFLMDVTERHALQQQIIQTEELRTLSEISARLAHEIRNPIAVAGGFARRLLGRLPVDSPHRQKVQIILKEMARLESILKRIQEYLKPVVIVPVRCDFNALVTQVLKDLTPTLQAQAVRLEVRLQPDLPHLMLDQELMKKSLHVLLKAFLSYCPEDGGTLKISSVSGSNAVLFEVQACGLHVSDDDIEHFFYPFTSRMDESRLLDLPLAKMILHRHRCLVRLQRKGEKELLLSVSFPLC
ncbi:cache domain-containing protein [Desulfosoma caldarium]|uniref:histidine kinase n=1 Tax=Desulfosoma caldarium TaxID=610254 RepID=A0A3N1VPZ8_9BACT|nr:cache domain-containing protein [Desulfosoma caldarium]ROR01967.1 PAS domain S-box-containing protein [Desulfosoma caldarium]